MCELSICVWALFVFFFGGGGGGGAHTFWPVLPESRIHTRNQASPENLAEMGTRAPFFWPRARICIFFYLCQYRGMGIYMSSYKLHQTKYFDKQKKKQGVGSYPNLCPNSTKICPNIIVRICPKFVLIRYIVFFFFFFFFLGGGGHSAPVSYAFGVELP